MHPEIAPRPSRSGSEGRSRGAHALQVFSATPKKGSGEHTERGDIDIEPPYGEGEREAKGHGGGIGRRPLDTITYIRAWREFWRSVNMLSTESGGELDSAPACEH